MQHFAARQRNADQRWDYTCRTGQGAVHPVGYCMPYSWIDPDKSSAILLSEEDKEKIRQSKDKHHSDGHATQEEAEQCYKNYLLDMRTFYDSKIQRQMLPCEVCGVFTQRAVSIDGWTHILCDDHANRGGVSSILSVGESWEGAE
jgi:hypothetical protein